MTNENKELTYEQAFQSLQGIVQRLETGDVPLEESLQLFETGVRMTKICQEALQKAQQRVEILTKATTDGTPQLQNFSSTTS